MLTARDVQHRLKLALLLLPLAGCVASAEDALDEEGGAVGGKADGAAAALEGTREGYGVLRLLNDGEGTTFEFLDDVVPLDRRAAANLVAHRDGADAEFGTADDDLFDGIAEVDAVSWVGPATLAQLAEFARLHDYLPADDDPGAPARPAGRRPHGCDTS